MMFKDTLLYAFLIISAFINVNYAESWDVAVTIGREIKFFSNEGNLIRNVTSKLTKQISCIAYDNISQTIYFGDNNNKSSSIFFTNFDPKEMNIPTLITNLKGSSINGIVYDPQSRTLFWTLSGKPAILKSYIDPINGPSKPEILLNLTSEIPRGLSIDLCNRRLYWANSNFRNLSSNIQSCNIDGSNHTIIIDEDIYQSPSVVVDYTTAKLYWLDDDEGLHYSIRRSNLDGTNQEIVMMNRGQTPFHIAVDHEKIYWTDWTYHTIWSLEKNITTKPIPKIWKTLDETSENTHPMGLIIRASIENVNCSAMRIIEAKNRMNEKEKLDGIRDNISSVALNKNIYKYENKELCLNGGLYQIKEKICKCKQGFNGTHCEQSMCDNYCLYGECKIITDNQVRCECNPEYNGLRCEKRICSDYCYNGGNCSIVDGQPVCNCKFSQGDRCEDINGITSLCATLCAGHLNNLNKADIEFCRCSTMSSYYTSREYNSLLADTRVKILIGVFFIITGIFIVTIVVLGYFVIKFRRRPRVKKRFLVSKSGITPLTSRPQLPNDQCEIMIENCCNMNICETPCFEPKLRNSQPNTYKKEEKSSLLSNMDGNNSY